MRPQLPMVMLLLASSCFAATEKSPVRLELRPVGDQEIALVVLNEGSLPLALRLELRASGGRLSGIPAQGLQLEGASEVSLPVSWVDAPVGAQLRARAWPVGSSAFTQARLYQADTQRLGLADFLADTPTRLGGLDPVEMRSEGRVVRGQVAFPTYTGGVEALARATVKLGGQVTKTDDEGRFKFSEAAAGAARVEVRMESDRWTVKHPRKSDPYSFVTPSFDIPEAGTLDLGEIMLPEGEPVTESAWIHHVAVLGERFLQAQGDDLSWWSKLPIAWPDRGDFYSWGTLHISEAHRWDVVGHELGHAIYFGASKFSGGGGSHKIDECYSEGLALSEGWATFFSAAIHLDRDDPDAKFEFLVPRRAPIRIENVPDDVCEGPRNEWRVAAFFWDLFDTHVDLEDQLDLTWKQASWQVMRSGFRAKGVQQATSKVKQALDTGLAAQVAGAAAQNKVIP